MVGPEPPFDDAPVPLLREPFRLPISTGSVHAIQGNYILSSAANGKAHITVRSAAGAREIFMLAATSDTLAYVRGLGRGKGSAVKVVTVDGHEEIQFMGVRYRKN